jgi:hypothetical protein
MTQSIHCIDIDSKKAYLTEEAYQKFLITLKNHKKPKVIIKDGEIYVIEQELFDELKNSYTTYRASFYDGEVIITEYNRFNSNTYIGKDDFLFKIKN